MSQGYQEGYNLEDLRNRVLYDLYHIIGRSIRNGLYAFKGGYVLRNLLGGDIRRTSDIDVSILDENTFELAMSPIITYLENLKFNSVIWDYTIKSPKIKNGRNVSGGVKVYCKPGPNMSKWVLCGVDMSIKEFEGGVVLTPEGYPRYCNEYMLADKLSVLYGDERTLLRRIRDVVDVYLILKLSDNSLNKELIRARLLDRSGKSYKSNSTFELMIKSKPDLFRNALVDYLSNGEKLNKNISYSVNEILTYVLKFLQLLRS